jgi:tetratricopeptide (TPR) repeat protein
MSVRASVLLWAQRVVARKDGPAHQVLEIAPDAGLEAAQEAFHKIARLAHPDLHRTALDANELELVTTAYARAAAAYQEFRAKYSSARLRPVREPGSSPAVAPTTVIPTSAAPNKAVALPDEPPLSAAQAMTSKALIQYRKAELCLRRGDLTQAVLHLKMAIACDPQSALLRSALAEVQAEVGKKP